MLRLNIRHTMPQIGIRSQISTLSSHAIRPEAHTEYVAPRSNLGVTQPRLEIDSYPSRHAYGYTNHDDFARQYGQEGKSDLRATVSRHTQHAWAIIDNAAKRGHDEIIAEAKSEFRQRATRQRQLDAVAIPDPEMHIIPGELVGTPDPGKYDWTVDVAPRASVQYNPGSFEVYLRQKGDIRRWVTEDKYDIYA